LVAFFATRQFKRTCQTSPLCHSATLLLSHFVGKRRYDRKQQGFGGQKKPVFHKNVKTTRKVALRLKCNVCTLQHQVCLKRTAHFEIGGAKKE
jgi:ribosomal protein L44E